MTRDGKDSESSSGNNINVNVGDKAKNVAAGTGNQIFNSETHDYSVIINGPSYLEIRQIILDLFELNFYRLTGIAASIASERATQITDKFLKTLLERNPAGILHAEDPDFQYSLFIAQREYAKSGDPDLAELLVDLLVDRTKEEARSLTSIVLNECLSVVSKLTSDQIAALTLVFLLRYTVSSNVNNYAALVDYVRELIPLISLLPRKGSAYQHLESMRCCSIQAVKLHTSTVFLQSYKWLFCKGFSIQQLTEKGLKLKDLSGIVRVSHEHSDLLQLTEKGLLIFRDLAEQNGLEHKTISNLIALQESNLMSEDEVSALLQSLAPALNALIEAWDNSTISLVALSSVGLAIGHANYKRLTGEAAPLSTWI